MTTSVIETDQLTKHFGRVPAVADVSLGVRRGEIYGFLGLNGAGKTTTIRMLLGMVRPTQGAAYLYGRKVDPSDYRLWESVGCLVEMPYSYPELTVRENLEIVRRLRSLPDQAPVTAVIERLKLGPYADRKAKHLSLGNGQRLGLAKALLHDPDILILDEPSNGLDPAGIVEIRELLRDMAKKRGATIFISSHQLGEVARLATRIGIVHHGRLVQEVDTVELDRLRRKRLLVDVRDRDAARSRLAQAGYPVDAADSWHSLDSGLSGHSVEPLGLLQITGEDAVAHPDRIACLLVEAGQPPTLLKVDEEDLESYFLRIIGMNGRVQG